AAKVVRLNIRSNWGGILMSYGLSEVQFSAIPMAARTPNPDSGAQDVDPRSTVLSWHSGREAGQHDVFVSADPNALDSANTVLDNSLALNSMNLSLDTTYYWQVNEVNDTIVPSTWTGDMWSFTTLSSLTVDDFESYSNLSPYRVFQTWIDGSGFANPAPGNSGNNTGSDIGHDIWSVASPHFQGSIVETSSTPAGSHQAMPVYYDNSGANGKLTYSQVDYAVGGQDWTAHGLQTLSIALRGTAGNTGTLYVTINHTKLVYNGDADDITREQWQQWNIDLTSLDGLQNVTTLAIGVDGANAAGTLYIDDIRLYP
ncbi:MAG: hypothetical protein GY809_10525, partial [Planctomycetes bacterium]|nr:hypothetical protein [Planctomycetota bacterium]